MNINETKELEKVESIIDDISEVFDDDIDSSMITEDVVLSAIKNNIDDNRQLNLMLNYAVCDLLCDDLLRCSKLNEQKRDM